MSNGLPDSLYDLGLTDSCICGDQWRAFYHGRGGDYAVSRIFGESGWQSDSESSNLRGYGLQNDARDRFANERLHAAEI